MGLSERELFFAYGIDYDQPTRQGPIPMPLITVTQGRKEGAYDGPDGTYVAALVEIGPVRLITATQGARAGQDVELRDWLFAIASGDHQDKTIDVSVSTASGPKSNTFKYLTALLGGVAPKIGASFEEKDLYGRLVLLTIQNVDGWPRVTNISAVPAGMLQQQFAAATGAPTQGTSVQQNSAPLNLQPAATPEAKPADALPF